VRCWPLKVLSNGKPAWEHRGKSKKSSRLGQWNLGVGETPHQWGFVFKLIRYERKQILTHRLGDTPYNGKDHPPENSLGSLDYVQRKKVSTEKWGDSRTKKKKNKTVKNSRSRTTLPGGMAHRLGSPRRQPPKQKRDVRKEC